MASHFSDGREPELSHPPQHGDQQHLVAAFLSQDEQELPPGVSPVTSAFLRDAILTGAWQRLDRRGASLIAAYFATEATLASLGRISGISKESVRRVISSGFRTLWEHLPTELQAQYFWEAVPKTKDRRARQREALKARWRDPAYRARMTAASRQRVQEPEVKARHSAAMKAIWQDPQRRARLLDRSKAARQDPTARARHSEAMKAALQDPQQRARNSAARKREWQDAATRARRQEAIKAAWQDPERRARQSETLKRAWQDPHKRDAMLRAKQDPQARALRSDERSHAPP